MSRVIRNFMYITKDDPTICEIFNLLPKSERIREYVLDRLNSFQFHNVCNIEKILYSSRDGEFILALIQSKLEKRNFLSIQLTRDNVYSRFPFGDTGFADMSILMPDEYLMNEYLTYYICSSRERLLLAPYVYEIFPAYAYAISP